jgi:predicted alpha/beta superfamily hydrolase
VLSNDDSPLVGTEIHYLDSAPVGDEYKIHIAHCAKPGEVATALYLPDAVGAFGGAVDIVRFLGLAEYVPPMLVVGIGYRVDSFLETEARRGRDLTPSVDPKRRHVPPESMGGAPRFLEFLTEELQPWVRGRYDVAPDDDAFFGFSFGGLFGTYVLFERPATFTRYGLGSPSLWYHGGEMFEREAAYAAAHDDLAARVLMTVGEYENEAGRRRHLDWLPPDKRAEAEEEDRAQGPVDLVGDTERMAGRLRGRSYPSLVVDAEVLPGEFHVTGSQLSLSRALRSLFDAPR